MRVARLHLSCALISATVALVSSACETTAPVRAVKLAFVVQPSDAVVGAVITPPVQVVVQDAEGNPVSDPERHVEIELGGNAAGGVLSGQSYYAFVGGVAHFFGLAIDRAGAGYTLTVRAEGLEPATSAPFDVITIALRSVSAGGPFTCGVTTDGSAYCWGDDYWGELGTGDSLFRISSVIPVPVAGGLTFAALTAASDEGYACGVTTAGSAYCWGDGANGVLGDGSADAHRRWTPVRVAGGLTFAALTAGAAHTCGLTTSGAAYCWGVGGLLGNGDTAGVATAPVPVAGGHSFAVLSANANSTCGVTTGGTAYCWGNVALGNGVQGSTSGVPVLVSGGLTWRTVSTGAVHACGVTTDGAAYCWGWEWSGELGHGSMRDTALTPEAVAGGLTFASVSAGFDFYSCGLATGGQAYCWGRNEFGQLGNGSTEDSAVPVPVSGGLTFAALSTGGSHTCGVTVGGVVYCWGENTLGQLGSPVRFDQFGRTTPVPVAGQGVPTATTLPTRPR
jgi:alpha-tubulin suppressor-like RCC1 family protein